MIRACNASQFAELVALPEGVPEELPVTCAGRSAVLNVRSQIVTFAGQRMSASRFETVCGKGDAKKWKSSIWLEGEDGGQEQVSSRHGKELLCCFYWFLPSRAGRWSAFTCTHLRWSCIVEAVFLECF